MSDRAAEGVDAEAATVAKTKDEERAAAALDKMTVKDDDDTAESGAAVEAPKEPKPKTVPVKQKLEEKHVSFLFSVFM